MTDPKLWTARMGTEPPNHYGGYQAPVAEIYLGSVKMFDSPLGDSLPMEYEDGEPVDLSATPKLAALLETLNNGQSSTEVLAKMKVSELVDFLKAVCDASAGSTVQTLTIPTFVLARLLDSHRRQAEVIRLVETSVDAEARYRQALGRDREWRGR